MRIGQEVHDAVLVIDRHTFIVSLESSMELGVRQNNALRITRCSTGIKDIGYIVERSLFLTGLHLSLAGQVLAQLQEIAEVKGIGIMAGNTNQGVEDDDTLQCRTERHHTAGTVVLLLFAHKQIANLGIVNHELYLLFTAGSIERYRYCPHAPCAEIRFQILH